MHSIIQKSFGGLTTQYYLRQFFFGLLMAVFFYFLSTRGGRAMPIVMLLYVVVVTFLYPYSRFVYERVIGFLMGENVFFVNMVLMLVVKLITMLLCWVFAVFVAPIGLAYLYFYHSKNQT